MNKYAKYEMMKAEYEDLLIKGKITLSEYGKEIDRILKECGL